ncbi:MAG TPA: 3-deoxy-manno-octulosonate cytidylyltransferase [Phycisphaerales bacterium]|nr:3-deoxy-manno-octulosonate cytidylyltransferase [Phycisphaerales bacterium]
MGGQGGGAGIKATVVVPARLASTRLPEKVLLAETGRPMVQHVVDGARAARCAREVVVATDSQRVAAALAGFGTRVVMTRADHPNGTSRLCEAAGLLGLADDDLVVNAQGDEPEMPAEVIDAAVAALVATPSAVVGTVCCGLGKGEDAANPNIVKVVRRADGCALYFSRSRVPADRDGRGGPDAEPLRHVGVYVYRVSFLKRYVEMASTPLERAESLEQLRVLENGFSIAVARCDAARGLTGIDTREQYDEFVRRWKAR